MSAQPEWHLSNPPSDSDSEKCRLCGKREYREWMVQDSLGWLDLTCDDYLHGLEADR